jgi:hypothetical protein
MEQLGPRRGLELLDPRGDARGHAMELARRLEDAALAHHREEDAQVGEVRAWR